MTFDEALYKLAMLSEFVGVSSNYPDGLIIKMTEAQDIILELRDTYMPMIEMTQDEKKLFDKYLSSDLDLPFAELLHQMNVINGYRQRGLFLELSEEDLMTAWLHPELIEVSEDD